MCEEWVENLRIIHSNHKLISNELQSLILSIAEKYIQPCCVSAWYPIFCHNQYHVKNLNEYFYLELLLLLGWTYATE